MYCTPYFICSWKVVVIAYERIKKNLCSVPFLLVYEKVRQQHRGHSNISSHKGGGMIF